MSGAFSHSDQDIELARLAEQACALSGKDARFRCTLDAAYAEAGRFTDTIALAEETRTLALTAGLTNIADAASSRLALYRKQQPFHQ